MRYDSNLPPAELGGVTAGWLIDGTGRKAVASVRVAIEGGRIRSIDRASEGMSPQPGEPGAVGDYRGCTLLPGLIDSHVHLCLPGASGSTLRARPPAAGAPEAAARIAANLERHAACGVVAVRDGGDPHGFTLRFAQSRAEGGGRPSPVVVKSGGAAWHRRGRYGAAIGRALPDGWRLEDAVAAAERVDFIKIVQSGVNSLTDYGRQTPPQFDAGEIAAAAAVARARGLGLMVHANGREAVAAAVAAGCLSIEHGYFMGRENLERMAAAGVFWVPTLAPMEALATVAARNPQEADVARRTLEHQLEQLQIGRGIGVAVAAGTDAGSPGVAHGAALRAELGLLMRAGFTVEEAVACATGHGARLLGVDGGVLAAGRPASFLAVPGPPGDLPHSLARIQALVIAGRPLSFEAAAAGGAGGAP